MLRGAFTFNRGLFRRFTSTGSTEYKTTTKIDAKGVKTYLYESVTYAKNTWSNMSPTARRLTYGYMGCMAVDNVYGTYQGGKEALEQFRHDQVVNQGVPKHILTNSDVAYKINPVFGESRTAETDWQAAYYGCRKDMFGRFLGSTIWPIGIFSKIMPGLIMWLNPPTKSKMDVVS